ncbi:major facilitator superfamily domain-containing protein [Aspergillus californicus]
MNSCGLPESWRVPTILYTLSLVNFAVAVTSASISTALPVIGNDIGASSIETFWLGTSFYLSSTVFQPLSCLLSDVFGRKTAILTSIAIFAIGSLVSGLSHAFANLIPGRCLQGLGAGSISVLSEVILTDIVPLRARGRWFGIIGIVTTLGFLCGPLIGGAFAELASWRWIFYINLPFAGIGLVLLSVLLQLEAETTPIRARFSNVDFIGIALFIPSTSSFLVAITWGGVLYPWYSWHTLVPLIVGALGLVIFTVYEHYVPPNPFVSPCIYRSISSTVNYFGIFILGMVMWMILYYLPLYYEAVKGYNMIVSGVALFPQTLTVGPVGIAVSIAIAKMGRYRWAVWLGWTLSTMGLGILRLLGVDTAVRQWIFINLPGGVGFGLLTPSIMLAIQASAPAEFLAISVTMVTTLRSFGRAVGVAIGGVIFQNRMRACLDRIPRLADRAPELSHDASALVQVIGAMSDSADRSSLKAAYAQSLADVWLATCCLSAVALISSGFLKSYSMDQDLRTCQPLRGSRHQRRGDNISPQMTKNQVA